MRIHLRKMLLSAMIILIAMVVSAQDGYLSMDPPADVDKNPLPPAANDWSCWLATASNMLAAAGYGEGDTLQERADDIYQDMTTNYGTANGGWTDTAITWWLASNNNQWAGNPYTDVTVIGNKFPSPWADQNGARQIANTLRGSIPVGLSISGATIDGHAFSAWGDDGPDADILTDNPGEVNVTDSDRDNGGDLQIYTYDDYSNPNPGGTDAGDGWYINYVNDHPYIKHIITLEPTDALTDDVLTQRIVGSYALRNNSEMEATDLHYDVLTDVTILRYRTTVSWETGNRPQIIEHDPRMGISVEWDFSDNPVPPGEWVTISTEFVVPTWNAMTYSNVYLTYPDAIAIWNPPISWEMITPIFEEAEYIENVTGGYVVGAFDIIDPDLPRGEDVIGQYRFLHEYDYNQFPDQHLFILREAIEYPITNLRFGHSYGYLYPEMLWEYDEWLTDLTEDVIIQDDVLELELDWFGRLPYPEGDR